MCLSPSPRWGFQQSRRKSNRAVGCRRTPCAMPCRTCRQGKRNWRSPTVVGRCDQAELDGESNAAAAKGAEKNANWPARKAHSRRRRFHPIAVKPVCVGGTNEVPRLSQCCAAPRHFSISFSTMPCECRSSTRFLPFTSAANCGDCARSDWRLRQPCWNRTGRNVRSAIDIASLDWPICLSRTRSNRCRVAALPKSHKSAD